MLKSIKHQFLAFRNGIVADALRKAGDPHSVIFGLQLPQITEISRSLPHDAELARTLWQDRNVRESRLLATRIFPADQLTVDEAYDMIRDVCTREEADILTFYLLKHTQHLPTLLNMIETSEVQDIGQSGDQNAAGADNCKLADTVRKWITDAIKRNIG